MEEVERRIFHGSVEWVFPLPPGQPWNIAGSCHMSCHWMGVITGCGAADLLRKTSHRFPHIFAIRRPKLLLFVESTVVKIRVLLYFLNFSQFVSIFPAFPTFFSPFVPRFSRGHKAASLMTDPMPSGRDVVHLQSQGTGLCTGILHGRRLNGRFTRPGTRIYQVNYG